MREIKFLRLCQGVPSIVQLQDVVAVSNSNDSFDSIVLVLELCDIDLAVWIDDYYQENHTSPFSLPNVKTLLHQLLTALQHLHQHHIVHRDVKLANVLYSNSMGSLKLADFGSARVLGQYPLYRKQREHELTPVVTSLWYRAPELVVILPPSEDNEEEEIAPPRGSIDYSFAVDLWAVGCIFGEILRGYPIFTARNEVELLQQMIHGLGMPVRERKSKDGNVQGRVDINLFQRYNRMTEQQKDSSKQSIPQQPPRWIWNLIQKDGLQLLTSLLEYHPSQRWTAKQALESSFFTTPPLPTPCEKMPRYQERKKKK